VTSGGNTNILVGATRRPMIAEIGVWCGPITTKLGTRVISVAAKVEICIPTKYGLPSNVVANRDIGAQIYFPNPDSPNDTNKIPGPATLFGNAITTTTDGDYTFVVYSRQVDNIPVPATYARRPTQAYGRLILNLGADGTGNGDPGTPFWDLAPAAQITNAVSPFPEAASVYVPIPVDAEGVAVGSIQSAQISDPRINKYQINWESGANTFGQKNFNWGKNVSANPPQDTDGGQISDASMQMPSPKINGRVESIAELGRIPTGTAINVPWRTLRFPTHRRSQLAGLGAFRFVPDSLFATITPRFIPRVLMPLQEGSISTRASGHSQIPVATWL